MHSPSRIRTDIFLLLIRDIRSGAAWAREVRN